MATKRLTENNVLTLPVKGKAYRVWDEGTGAARGLHILVQPTGTKTWRVTYRLGGQRATIKLGRVGVMTLQEARDKTRDAQRLADKGDDPQLSAPNRSGAFKACVEEWSKDQVRAGFVSAETSKQYLLNATKALHARPVATLRYPELKALLADKATTHASSANRLHGHLCTFFNWCVTNERIAVNPLHRKPVPDKRAKVRRREAEWFSSDDAIKKVWQAADVIGGDAGRLIKLCLVTGKRRGAVQTMQWRQIGEDWYWQPPTGTVTKRLNPIPLPKLAQRILSPRGEGQVLEWVSAKVTMAQVRKLTGIDDFIFHGLRHVVATKLRQLRVNPYISRQLLDHAELRDVHTGYEHHDNREELLVTLEKWSAYIEELVAPAAGISVLR